MVQSEGLRQLDVILRLKGKYAALWHLSLPYITGVGMEVGGGGHWLHTGLSMA